MAEHELSGVWNVERTGGLLPPLVGVRKRIIGTSGTTQIGPIHAAPFDLVGLELHYRFPFKGFVDVLEPDGPQAFKGRATLGGRTFGTFRMTRLSGS